MKPVFYNPKKAELEEEEKKKKLEELDKKKDYFKYLAKDKRFKKYIMAIIDHEIMLNSNISNNVEEMVKATPEEAKAMLLAKVGALKTAQNIKNRITANF